ncbi:MAG: uncharacterized protein KVP18_002222 [Porospora cf. gigantea A]|uniref:uncharacterized protein n=1 Tax=Porospora cf. gigantea A TaxID=2853593 RepID=UPI00355937F9|nr:MAG: hypothetical protein KVP18_002222 [Porospora cf. gigantea A]
MSWHPAIDCAVCTFEKANNILNKLLAAASFSEEEEVLDRLGVVVVDEVHLLGDPERGFVVETILAKLLYIRRTRGHRPLNPPVQIVALSATFPNVKELAAWLGCPAAVSHERPVPLSTYVLHSGRRELRKVVGGRLSDPLKLPAAEQAGDTGLVFLVNRVLQRKEWWVLVDHMVAC